MDREVKTRLRWVLLYFEVGNAVVVCRCCGISRPTLRKWLKRYEEAGIEGLRSQSRRPYHSPAKKVLTDDEELILQLRQRGLGTWRIRNELRRLHEISLSLATVYRVMSVLSGKTEREHRGTRKA